MSHPHFERTEDGPDAHTRAAHLAAGIASALRRVFRRAGYDGPVVVAGGYVRDVALGLEPKDLDVFLDAGKTTAEMRDAMVNFLWTEFATTIRVPEGQTIYEAPTLGKTLKSYGSWAEDLEVVKKLTPGDTIWFKDLGPRPWQGIDLVFLREDAMVAVGYVPEEAGPEGAALSFLQACLSRVDLTVNAIGSAATDLTLAEPQEGWPAFCLSSIYWVDDVLAKRLVLQASRVDNDGDIQSRLVARVKRQLASKFEGWTAWVEHPDLQEPQTRHLVPWNYLD